jgi:hypothetical protein
LDKNIADAKTRKLIIKLLADGKALENESYLPK